MFSLEAAHFISQTVETKEDEETTEGKVTVTIETKTPVPLETPESPQSVTPIPEPAEESHMGIDTSMFHL